MSSPVTSPIRPTPTSPLLNHRPTSPLSSPLLPIGSTIHQTKNHIDLQHLAPLYEQGHSDEESERDEDLVRDTLHEDDDDDEDHVEQDGAIGDLEQPDGLGNDQQHEGGEEDEEEDVDVDVQPATAQGSQASDDSDDEDDEDEDEEEDDDDDTRSVSVSSEPIFISSRKKLDASGEEGGVSVKVEEDDDDDDDAMDIDIAGEGEGEGDEWESDEGAEGVVSKNVNGNRASDNMDEDVDDNDENHSVELSKTAQPIVEATITQTSTSTHNSPTLSSDITSAKPDGSIITTAPEPIKLQAKQKKRAVLVSGDGGIPVSTPTTNPTTTTEKPGENGLGNPLLPIPTGLVDPQISASSSMVVDSTAPSSSSSIPHQLTAKPKQKKKKRSPSPDELVPPPPRPLQTVRIEISLDVEAKDMVKESDTTGREGNTGVDGGESNIASTSNNPNGYGYTYGTTIQGINKINYKVVSFKAEAVRSGVVDEEYWLPAGMELDIGSEGEDDDDDDDDDDEGMDGGAARGRTGKKAKEQNVNGDDAGMKAIGLGMGLDEAEMAEMARIAAELHARHDNQPKKRKAKKDAYNLNDPFVDDSELRVDEPDYYRKPKKDGFYVQKGLVELMEEAPARPKKKTKLDSATAPVKAKPKAVPSAIDAILNKSTKKLIPMGMGKRPDTKKPKKASLVSIAPAISATNGNGNTTGNAYAGPSNTKPKSVTAPALLPVLTSTPLTPIISAHASPVLNQAASNHAVPIAPAAVPSWVAAGDSQRMDSGQMISVRSDSPEVQVTGAVIPPVPPKKLLPPVNLVEALSRLPDPVAEALRPVKALNELESWKDKKRFPPALIDPMIHAIGVAIETESFNEKFFDALPFVINYNRFTMKKWSLSRAEEKHTAYTAAKQAQLLAEMKSQIDTTITPQIAEHEKQTESWQEALQSPDSTYVVMDGSNAVQPPKISEPQKRFRWTPALKDLFWQLVVNVDRDVDFCTELALSKGAKPIKTPIPARTTLYSQVIELFPKGWMTSRVLSVHMSAMKKKMDAAPINAQTAVEVI